MSLPVDKDQLKAQIIDTEHLLSLVKDHPLMSFSLEKKLEELNEQLNELPEDINEPKVSLLFSGKAVIGSKGIKTKFISDALKPFQELIKTQTALVRYGKVGKRGKSKNSKISDLYLTALPTGSFGVELSQIDPSDIFAEEDISTAIHQVMELVEASTTSDEEFEEILEITPARNLNNLKNFLKYIDKEKSILKMVSGTNLVSISEEDIHKGFVRVNAANKEDEEIFEDGILRGALLETAKFEFVSEDGYRFTGMINTNLPEDIVISFLNHPCTVHMRRSHTHFMSGTDKTTYELLDIFERKTNPEQIIL
ncbi:hypothetical protein NYQ10_11280 [Flavobacterium johnsoniae]|uniref:hypothetical protein n=1 Tax=Flavobacterium johnsoniae TaxID=986 RepID=UPI0025AFAA28|nr:hypothetical protein [Flavobacterium johnsoniae]WJS97016.1 hypothetical protein NYQ10_11280 [Flavobacterium johnsoniae]